MPRLALTDAVHESQRIEIEWCTPVPKTRVTVNALGDARRRDQARRSQTGNLDDEKADAVGYFWRRCLEL